MQADLALVHETRRAGGKGRQQRAGAACACALRGRGFGRASAYRRRRGAQFRHQLSVAFCAHATTVAVDDTLRQADKPRASSSSGAPRAAAASIFEDVQPHRQFRNVHDILQICKANDRCAIEFARRLVSARANVAVACLKVGVVKTNIRKEFPRLDEKAGAVVVDPLLRATVANGGGSTLRLVPDDEPGRPSILYSQFPLQAPAPRRPIWPTLRRRARLWDLSEQLVSGRRERR